MRTRPRKNCETLLLALGLGLLPLQRSGFAGMIRVPSDQPTIQEAIDAAIDGDTVVVAPGEYVITEPIDFNRLHDPDDPGSPPVKNISVLTATVLSDGAPKDPPNDTVIRMSDEPTDPDRASVVIFENGESSDSRLEGFTLSGGVGTLIDGREEEGLWVVGGGVFCVDSSPIMSRCVISANTAEIGGGFFWSYGASPTLLDSVVKDNSVYRGGGGGGTAWGDAAGTIQGCVIRGNVADVEAAGGLYCALRSTLEISDSTIAENSAFGSGGGIEFVFGSGGVVRDCVIRGNSSVTSSGGGISCRVGSTLELVDSEFADNTAEVSGGALFFANTPSSTVSRCDIVRNATRTDSGGGVGCVAGSRVLIADSTIAENVAGAVGGGLLFWGQSSGMVERCQIRRNVSVGGIGGGVFCGENSRPHFKSHTVISGNAVFSGHVADAHGGGLAIFASPRAIIEECFIEGNYSEYAAGGVDFWDSSAILTNSIISGNSAENWGGGVASRGSVFNEPHIVNCTITHNRAANRGGVAKGGQGNPRLVNTVLWSNVPNSAEAVLITCLVGVDPRFVAEPVHDFDRFEEIEVAGLEVLVPSSIETAGDYHLRAGSPAIDAGSLEIQIPNTRRIAPETDIEGTPRPQGDGVDIGAYETVPTKTAFLRGDTNNDGDVDLSDAVAVLRFLFLGHEDPTCLAAANSNGDAAVDVADPTYLLNHLFLGGPAPTAPSAECGTSELDVDAELSCEDSPCP